MYESSGDGESPGAMVNRALVSELVSSKTHIDEICSDCDDVINDLYIGGFRPVKIHGMDSGWNTGSWTFSFLRREFSDLVLPVRRTNTNTLEEEKRDISVAEFVDYVFENEKNPAQNPYYLNGSLHPTKKLRDDYEVPSYFKCRFDSFVDNPDRPTLSWIYLAPTNSITALHIDICQTNAWNLVISGKKFWVFYPPSQNPFLYDGSVNPFSPDFDRFPEFEKADPMVCVQRPGEVVFTPSGWYHAVLNLEMGVSLTENFICESNIGRVREHCEAAGVRVEELYE